MNRTEKGELVAQMNHQFQKSSAAFVTDFQGMKVEQMRGLRIKIREAGGDYTVVKNTLARLAVKDTGNEVITELLVGNTALSTTDGDPAVLAKTLIDFAKTNEKLVIKGAALSGRILSYEDVKALADLPSREVMLSRLLGTMNAVPSSFVRVLAAVPQKLVYALAAIRDAKEAPAA